MDLIDKYLGEKVDHTKSYGAGKGGEFVHLYKDEDGWNITHSIHNTPQSGGQVIKTLKSEKEAVKLAEKLAKKWNATLARWNKKGFRFTSA